MKKSISDICDEIIKSKYIKRTGSPGNYRYEYADLGARHSSKAKEQQIKDAIKGIAVDYDYSSIVYHIEAISRTKAYIHVTFHMKDGSTEKETLRDSNGIIELY